MRTSAIPSMLEVLARNRRARNAEAMLYEIATEYIPTGPGTLPEENQVVMIGLYGPDADFYRLKGIVEALLERTGIAGWAAAREGDDPAFHPGRCAALRIGGEQAGIFGQIHPAVADSYETDTPFYLARIDMAALLRHATQDKTYRPLPRFPASTRDLALVCAEEAPAAELEKAMRGAIGGLLERCSLFDVYRGPQIGEGNKSLAYALQLRAPDRTLTDEECDRLVQKALRALESIGARLRG